MISRRTFEKLIIESCEALPPRFRDRIKNVAVLVEDEPSSEVRKEEGLGHDETLLGYYRGIPATERGEGYGVGPTLPDTITLYQKPIEEAAAELAGGEDSLFESRVRDVIFDTVWHEFAHYFGMNEDEVATREQKRGR
ncbi:MAG: metallopeptidase family protein [Parcubacteria group bacterium]|nr:metallopeptidase family protein [Parcubacteria group bacterium]